MYFKICSTLNTILCGNTHNLKDAHSMKKHNVKLPQMHRLFVLNQNRNESNTQICTVSKQ